MRASFPVVVATAIAATSFPSFASTQSHGGLTASIALGGSHGFRGNYRARDGLAGVASLASSVRTTPALSVTVGLEASFTTAVGVGADACVGAPCTGAFPAVSGIAVELGWLAGRRTAGVLFSGAVGVGRLAASGATGLGYHLDAGIAVPIKPTWAMSVEGRVVRTPRVVTQHLIVGSLLLGLRWHPGGS